MARGRGAIPPYGKNFRLVSLPWSPNGLASRAYVLKRDSRWFIRSDNTSEVWRIYHWNLDHDYDLATSLAPPLPTLTAAMTKLLDGIDQGFYLVKDFPQVHVRGAGAGAASRGGPGRPGTAVRAAVRDRPARGRQVQR